MVRVGLKFFSSKVSTDDLLEINLLSTVGEGQNTYNMPINPLLSSELPLPQMASPME